MPKDSEDIDLVLYYLIPVLSGIIKSDFDRALLENFVSKYSGESRRG